MFETTPRWIRARVLTSAVYTGRYAPAFAWRRRNVGTSRSSVGISGSTSLTLRETCCTTVVCEGATGVSRPDFHVFGRYDGRVFVFLAPTSRKPAAITVIFTDSFIASSCTAPKMMLAFSCAAFWMIDEAS